MVRPPVVAVFLTAMVLFAGCSINVSPSGGTVTDGSTETAVETSTTDQPATDGSTTEESTAEPSTPTEERTADASPAEESTREAATEGPTTEESPPEEETSTEKITSTEEPTTEASTTEETTAEEPTTDSSTPTGGSATEEPTAEEPSPTKTPTEEPAPNETNQTKVGSFPQKPDDLTRDTVVPYVVEYEEAYLRNSSSVSNNASSGPDHSNISIEEFDVQETTVVAEIYDGFTVRLDYELEYTASREGQSRTGNLVGTAYYFVNETEIRRSGSFRDPDDRESDPSVPDPNSLPEEPDNLTQDTATAYVEEYEEAYLRNELVNKDGESGITAIESFSVLSTSVINETNDSIAVQLQYRFTYTMLKEGEEETTSAVVTVDYFVTETETKRATTNVEQDEVSATAMTTTETSAGTTDTIQVTTVDQIPGASIETMSATADGAAPGSEITFEYFAKQLIQYGCMAVAAHFGIPDWVSGWPCWEFAEWAYERLVEQ